MKYTAKALLSVLALSLLLVASPVMAAEVGVDQLNEETGFDSDNDNNAEADNDRNIDIDNNGDVDNDADVDADTGHNEQNKNTKGGDLESGEVDVTGEWESVINRYDLCDCLLGDDGLEVTGDQENNMTGAESENKNKIDVDNDLTVDIDNIADVFNDLDFDANTGHNEQNKNTKAGDLETGDAGLEFLIASWANNSSGSGDGGSDVVVDATQSNMITGADSTNKNEVLVDNDLNVDVRNDADIDNNVDVDIDTGHNNQNKNTKGGDLKTGNGEVILGIETKANNSDCCVAKGGDLEVTANQENNMTLMSIMTLT